MSRDITLFNDNGTAYMISAADENYDLHIYRLTAGLPQRRRRWSATSGTTPHREAPAMFKRGSTYFLLTSARHRLEPEPGAGTRPRRASPARGPAGPTSATRTTYSSQPTYVLPIQGTQTTSYLYMGDRWAGAWGGPVNDSQYVWLPISFPSSTSMSLSWYAADHRRHRDRHDHRRPRATYYRITARNSGKVMDVVSTSTANNAEVKQYAWNGGGNQKWTFQDAGGGYFRVVNQNSGKCLDVASASTADGANIIQYTCGSGTNQQWQWAATGSYFQLRARHSGKCLDVVSANTADGADIQQYACGSGTNQQWSRTQV